MAELKTKPTGASVEAFLEGIAAEGLQQDCRTLVDLMQRVSGSEPEMWGGSIVGFGRYRYRYASGREGEWFEVGFAPRKRDLTLYLMAGAERYPDLLSKLGKYRTGVSCLYVKRLADIDLAVLEELAAASVAFVRQEAGQAVR